MIRSVLILRTAPERVQDVLDLYRAEGILQESLDLTRATASEISVARDGSGEMIVTALWPDEAAYREWIDHPGRGRTREALSALLADASVGEARLFRIDHDVRKP